MGVLLDCVEGWVRGGRGVGHLLVICRDIVVMGTPNMSWMVFRRLDVTSEWFIKPRAFSLATRYMFSFWLCFSWVVGVGRW